MYREPKLRPETHPYAANSKTDKRGSRFQQLIQFFPLLSGVIAFRTYRQSVEAKVNAEQLQDIGDIPDDFAHLFSMLVQDRYGAEEGIVSALLN